MTVGEAIAIPGWRGMLARAVLVLFALAILPVVVVIAVLLPWTNENKSKGKQ